MIKSIKVVIDGKEYTLKSENEKIVEFAANEVNNQLNELKSKYTKESPSTITVLAALNIAAKLYELQEKYEKDYKFVEEELNSLTNYIEKNIN